MEAAEGEGRLEERIGGCQSSEWSSGELSSADHQAGDAPMQPAGCDVEMSRERGDAMQLDAPETRLHESMDGIKFLPCSLAGLVNSVPYLLFFSNNGFAKAYRGIPLLPLGAPTRSKRTVWSS